MEQSRRKMFAACCSGGPGEAVPESAQARLAAAREGVRVAKQQRQQRGRTVAEAAAAALFGGGGDEEAELGPMAEEAAAVAAAEATLAALTRREGLGLPAEATDAECEVLPPKKHTHTHTTTTTTPP
jgi:hypothetical protein